MRWTLPPRSLLNVLLAGLTLRWIGLDRFALWLDEGVTWSWTQLATWGDTVTAEANHPPVWWLVTRLWTGIFGDSEAALRQPAALCGAVAVFLSWRLGLRLFAPEHAPRRGGFAHEQDGGAGARTALWFAGFVATATYFVEVSQEARMYALLLAESLGLALLYLRWLDRDDRGSLVAYALLAVLALHTHYFAVWPLLALGVHALWLSWRSARSAEPAQRVRLTPFVLANLAAGLLFVPWVLYFVSEHQRVALGDGYDPWQRLVYLVWRIGAGPALLVVDVERLKSSVGATLAEEAPIAIGVTALWLPSLVLGVLALKRRRGVGSLVLCSLLVPVLALLVVFPWFPLLHERYVVFLAPWLWLVAVVGARAQRPVLRTVLLASLSLLVVTGLIAYHGVSSDLEVRKGGPTLDGLWTPTEAVPDPHDPTRFLHHGHPFGKEPWREARDLVHHYAAPGDLVVLFPGYLHFVWDYYARLHPDRPLETLKLPTHLPSAEELLALHEASFARRKRVFLVLSHTEGRDPTEVYRTLYKALGAAWARTGASGIEGIPPIPLRLSWGIHVAMFGRKG